MQSEAPRPVIALQYDDTRPEVLMRVIRVFCIAQVALAVLQISRLGVDSVRTVVQVGGGSVAGAFGIAGYLVSYTAGPLLSGIALLAVSLAGMRFSPATPALARTYCILGWFVATLTLVVQPFFLYQSYGRSGGNPAIANVAYYLVANSALAGISAFVQPTMVWYLMRIPAVRAVFQGPRDLAAA